MTWTALLALSAVSYALKASGPVLAGALLGGGIGDPSTLGLDAMFPAAFLALLAPQLRRPGAPVAAAAGVVIALALVPFAPAGVPIIAALAGVVPGVLTARGVRG